MSTKSTVIAGLLAVTCTCCGPGGDDEPIRAAASSVALVPGGSWDVDFGTVAAGSVLDHTFEVVNGSGHRIVISRVLSDCSCHTAEYPRELTPGESGAVVVSVTAPTSDGRFSTVMRVLGHSIGKPQSGLLATLVVRGVAEVTTIVRATPEEVQLHLEGDVLTGRFYVESKATRDRLHPKLLEPLIWGVGGASVARTAGSVGEPAGTSSRWPSIRQTAYTIRLPGGVLHDDVANILVSVPYLPSHGGDQRQRSVLVGLLPPPLAVSDSELTQSVFLGRMAKPEALILRIDIARLTQCTSVQAEDPGLKAGLDGSFLTLTALEEWPRGMLETTVRLVEQSGRTTRLCLYGVLE